CVPPTRHAHPRSRRNISTASAASSSVFASQYSPSPCRMSAARSSASISLWVSFSVIAVLFFRFDRQRQLQERPVVAAMHRNQVGVDDGNQFPDVLDVLTETIQISHCAAPL